jgi:type VI secretion system secreted protein VgrG
MSADSLTAILESTHNAIQLSLTFASSDGKKKKEEAIVVERVQGREALSELFAYEIVVATSAERAKAFARELAHDVTLEVLRNGTLVRRVRGIVTEVRSDGVPLADHRRRTTLVVMPKLAELQRLKTSRVYKRSDTPSAGYSVKDIVALLLDGLNVEARWALGRQLDVYVHRMQFQETHYDFMRRLLAFEGIHFYFAHEEEKTVIVFTDTLGLQQDKDRPKLTFRTSHGGVTSDEVRNLRSGERIRTDAVLLDDYNYERPALAMVAPSPEVPEGRRVVYEHPGGYMLPESVGKKRAQRRLEELNDSASRLFGESNCPRLFAGSRFAISGHTDAAFDGELVATHVSFTAVASNAARGGENPLAVDFRAVGAGTPLRPMTRPSPIPPIQSAVVVGPEQDKPHVRAPGLVKVLFHWDVTSEADVSLEDRCAWVRVATDVAGQGYGTVMWPRVGMEVVVDFLNGKLDEPVIVRTLYNGVNAPPYLPGDETRSGFKSSTVGADGHNEWYFEDAAGKELVYLHAQRDRKTIVEKHDNESVKGSQTVNVGGAQTESVGGAQTVNVGGAQTVKVAYDRSITVEKGNETHKVKAGSRTVETKLADSLTAERVLVKAREKDVEIDGAAKVRLHSGDPNYITVSSSGEIAINADAQVALAVKGNQIKIDQGTIELTAGMNVIIKVGQNKVYLKEDGTVEVSASKQVKVSNGGSTVVLDGSGAAIDAPLIKLNCS